jgi:exodeoxyribonuclease III
LSKPIKLLSWNVNGIRAVMRKNFSDFISDEKPDILCLQELKCQSDTLPEEFASDKKFSTYFQDCSYAEKRGYSGVGIFSKEKPLSVKKGFGFPLGDSEGRSITFEFADFYLVNNYFPNSQHGLLRLPFKMEFNKKFLAYVNTLKKKKPVVMTGDFNVAHEEIDLKNPKQNTENPGFYIDERNWFTELISPKNAFIDTFRNEHPGEPDHYSWWSMRSDARSRNIGWRIDYFVADQRLEKNFHKTAIHTDIHGADHCPVELSLKF